MLRGPFGISTEGHDGRKPYPRMIGHLNQDGHQPGQDDVLFLVDHATHGPQAEQRRLETLPVGYLGLRHLGAVSSDPVLDEGKGLAEALGDSDHLATVLEDVAGQMSVLTKPLLLLAVAVEQIVFVSVLGDGELEVLDHDLDEPDEDAGELQAGLDVLLEDEVHLHLVPEVECERDGIAIPIHLGTFEDTVDQGLKGLGHSGDEHHPGFTGLGEDPGQATVDVMILGSACQSDPRSQGDDTWVERLDRAEILVHLLGLLEDDGETVDGDVEGGIVVEGGHDDIHQGGRHHIRDGYLAKPGSDAFDEQWVRGGGS